MANTKFSARSRFKRPRNKRLVWALAGIVLLAGTAAALDAMNVIDIPGFKDTPSEKINYDPPTEEEKKETEAFKKELANSENTPVVAPATPGQKQSVSPYVTSWGYSKLSGNAEISGYVTGVIESGGTCTLTMKKGSQTVSENKPATPDAQHTSCGLISISRSSLSAGTWTAVLSYSSPSAEGSSQQVTMEVE